MFKIDNLEENIYIYSDVFQEYLTVVENLYTYDSSFYRVYSTCTKSNEDLVFGNINGLKTYDSVYQYQLHDFLEILRLYPDVDWNFDINHPYIFNLLGVKYMILANEDISEYSYYLNDTSIEEVSTENISVYALNEDPIFAKTYNEIITVEELILKSQDDANFIHDVVLNLQTKLAINEEYITQDKIEKYINHTDYVETSAMPTYVDTNIMKFELILNQASPVYLSVPYDKGWQVYVNDEMVDL